MNRDPEYNPMLEKIMNVAAILAVVLAIATVVALGGKTQ